MADQPLPADFLELSAKIGSNPLLVQGAGGNTSVKIDGVMWIKASGTVLADAQNAPIFVAVDPKRALAELDGAGDGSCRNALLDPADGKRPSIETTFHAMFDDPYVFHFHSVNAICHGISPQGQQTLTQKLEGLNWVSVPYRKPGIPLSRAIRDAVGEQRFEVIVLENHGIILVGPTVQRIAELIDEVESRLELESAAWEFPPSDGPVPAGWQAVPDASGLALDSQTFTRATAGTYYPDHVVFLGPALPQIDAANFANLVPESTPFPAIVVPSVGVFLKSDASDAHRSMLGCLVDVLRRIPGSWELQPIGELAERELLDWDAEKYRQALAQK